MTIAEFINKVGFKVKQEDVKKVNETISDIKSNAAKLLGAIGIGFSLTNLKNLSEEFNGINDKINYAVKGLADQKEAQQAILKAANDTKSSYESMAGTVTNLVKAGSDLFSVDEAVNFSSAVTKLLKTAGRGDGEIQSVMDGLNKSFQKGAVESETLNVMLEQCPEGSIIYERFSFAAFTGCYNCGGSHSDGLSVQLSQKEERGDQAEHDKRDAEKAP